MKNNKKEEIKFIQAKNAGELKKVFYDAYNEYQKVLQEGIINPKTLYMLKRNMHVYVNAVARLDVGREMFTLNVGTATFNRISFFLDEEKGKIDSLVTLKELYA